MGLQDFIKEAFKQNKEKERKKPKASVQVEKVTVARRNDSVVIEIPGFRRTTFPVKHLSQVTRALVELGQNEQSEMEALIAERERQIREAQAAALGQGFQEQMEQMAAQQLGLGTPNQPQQPFQGGPLNPPAQPVVWTKPFGEGLGGLGPLKPGQIIGPSLEDQMLQQVLGQNPAIPKPWKVHIYPEYCSWVRQDWNVPETPPTVEYDDETPAEQIGHRLKTAVIHAGSTYKAPDGSEWEAHEWFNWYGELESPDGYMEAVQNVEREQTT